MSSLQSTITIHQAFLHASPSTEEKHFQSAETFRTAGSAISRARQLAVTRPKLGEKCLRKTLSSSTWYGQVVARSRGEVFST